MIRTRVPQPNSVEKAREKCLRKFLHYFPKGYRGQKFQHWERDYKWKAHETWEQQLGKPLFKQLILEKSYPEIVRRALSIESRTNLLFSFEKMALRDAVRAPGRGRQDHALHADHAAQDPGAARAAHPAEIGRASCRERV